MQLFDDCKDGLILCKLINDSVPDTIDNRVLNKSTPRKPLNAFQITENNNIVITSAKAIGCSVVNIGSSDIAEGREHLILGLIWQIIRRGLLAKVDLKYHPELYRLCEDGETIEDLLRLTPDQILVRWFNYHLRAAGSQRRYVERSSSSGRLISMTLSFRVNNFSRDVSDGICYTYLLHQLNKEKCSLAPLKTPDLRMRAEQASVLDVAYFVSPTDEPLRSSKTLIISSARNISQLLLLYPGTRGSTLRLWQTCLTLTMGLSLWMNRKRRITALSRTSTPRVSAKHACSRSGSTP